MENIKGKIYLLLAFMLAGTSVVTGYILSEKLGCFSITSISLGIMLFCLYPFYFRKIVQTIRLLTRNDWKMIISQAVFGILLFRLLLLLGVGFTSTVEAGILIGTTPAITALLAYFILREKFSVWAALGIGCVLAGITLLQGINLYPVYISMQHIWGNLLVIGAAASESVFNIISRKHRASMQFPSELSIHPMVQTLLVSTFAFIMAITPAFWEKGYLVLPMITLQEWLALVWYGMVVTALAFLFFYEGVKLCDAYITAAFSGMIPVTSMLLSLFFLKEPIGILQWIGATLIIFGMLMIGRNTTSGETKPGMSRGRGLDKSVNRGIHYFIIRGDKKPRLARKKSEHGI